MRREEPVGTVADAVECVAAVTAAQRLARSHEMPCRDGAAANFLGFSFNRGVGQMDFGAFDRLARKCVDHTAVNRRGTRQQWWRLGKSGGTGLFDYRQQRDGDQSSVHCSSDAWRRLQAGGIGGLLVSGSIR